MSIKGEVNKLFENQLNSWQFVKTNYEDLQQVETKILTSARGYSVKVQFNPKRIKSSSAKIDKQSIAKRPCFLCSKNRPKEQASVDFKNFKILINPYPLFHRHLTIIHEQHRKQEIKPFFSSMLKLCKELPDYTVFYNGPKCGASAPDHFHFQAGVRNYMPMEKDFEAGKYVSLAINSNDYQIFNWVDYYSSVITIKSPYTEIHTNIFNKIYNCLHRLYSAEPEPMLNVLAYYHNREYIVHVAPRMLHRPKCYFENGAQQMLISPGSADMGGLFTTVRREDFEKITIDDIMSICNQVCIPEKDISNIINYLQSNI